MNEKIWQEKASKMLTGAQIKSVRYATEAEMNQIGWSKRPLIIVLDNGVQIYASSDDEGNEAGSLFTNIKSLPTIPAIR